jgi:nitrogen-specific signal transduction histidine kinase
VLRRYAGPLRDENQRVVGRIVTVEDATAASEMQRQLTQAQKMESIGRLAGGVAHDFNNLLGTVLGFSSLLLEQTPATDARRPALEQIAQAAERASNLTAALLAFSRTSRFERVPVSLNRVVEDSYQIVRSMLDPSVAVAMKLEPSLPPIQGDALLLQQVVVSLVQELRERMSGAGAITLSTRAFEASVPSEETDSSAHARRMVGFAAHAVVPVETEPADRRAATRSEGGVGEAREAPGLSLTIAEDIARAHGGYLVALETGSTASFEVVFPVERQEQAPVMTPEPAAADSEAPGDDGPT